MNRLLIFILFFLGANKLYAQSIYTIPREITPGNTVEFEEKYVLPLEGRISINQLNCLRRLFCEAQNANDRQCNFCNTCSDCEGQIEIDQPLADYEEAGFVFTPVWCTEIRRGEGSESPQIEHLFTTNGIRVSLVVWKATESLPDILLLNLDNLDALLAPNPPADLINNKAIIETTSERLMPQEESITDESSRAPENSSQVDYCEDSRLNEAKILDPNYQNLFACSREFDFVFLPISAYKFLVEDNSYYKEGSIPAIEERGLTFERSLNTTSPFPEPNGTNNCDGGYRTYRTLLFKPYPDPFNDTGNETQRSTAVPGPSDSESNVTKDAIAFRWGEPCPPWWQPDPPPPENRESALQQIIAATVSNSPPDDQSILDSSVFIWLIIILIILLLIYLILNQKFISESLFWNRLPRIIRTIYWILLILDIIIIILMLVSPGIRDFIDNIFTS